MGSIVSSLPERPIYVSKNSRSGTILFIVSYRLTTQATVEVNTFNLAPQNAAGMYTYVNIHAPLVIRLYSSMEHR